MHTSARTWSCRSGSRMPSAQTSCWSAGADGGMDGGIAGAGASTTGNCVSAETLNRGSSWCTEAPAGAGPWVALRYLAVSGQGMSLGRVAGRGQPEKSRWRQRRLFFYVCSWLMIRVGRRRVVVGVAVLNGKCGKPCVRLTAHHPHVESGEEGGLNAHQRALLLQTDRLIERT